MPTSYILSIDQGTTGSSATLFNAVDLSMVATSKVEFTQRYPKNGWVEHNPEEIWESVLTAIAVTAAKAKKVHRSFSLRTIVAIGITNQRETIVPLDRATGKSLGNAIVWQDRRTATRCDRIKKNATQHNLITGSTGLVCDPYFSATKIEWLLRNNTKVRLANKKGTLGFCTIDSYLIFKLTGNSIFATEDSNASRTMLYDLRTGEYSETLLELFGIPRETLPRILPSAGGFGVTQGVRGLPNGIPITGVLGDQQAALFAHGGTDRGIGKITFGTGAFLLINTGSKVPKVPKGLLGTVAYRIGAKRSFAVEGSAFIAGAAVQFIRDNFSWIQHSPQVESLALKDPRDSLLAFVPSLSGLGAPYWNPYARGAIVGLSRGSSKSQITRSVLEAIALQNVSLVTLMQKSLKGKIKKLGVDGGVAKSDFVMQFQADVLRVALHRGAHTEMTALGAAMIARVGLGKSPKHKNITSTPGGLNKIFYPRMKNAEASTIVEYWNRAVDVINNFSSRSTRRAWEKSGW